MGTRHRQAEIHIRTRRHGGDVVPVRPHAARARKADRLRRIGVLDGHSRKRSGRAVAHFCHSSRNCKNWVGRRAQLKIELRWSGGDASRIKDYTAELVRLAPHVIVANSSPVVAALERETRSIRIVFVVVNDPVEQGFIPSMAQPGATSPGFHLSIFLCSGSRFNCSGKSRPA